VWAVRVADNGLQAGPVCSLEHLSTECFLKILMFVAFAKMKNCLPKLFTKAITSSVQIGLA
jgi:hypothetical protein